MRTTAVALVTSALLISVHSESALGVLATICGACGVAVLAPTAR